MASPNNIQQPLKPGLTPLPPSPETRPTASQISDIDPVSLTLNGSNVNNSDPYQPSRLRSIAKYRAFSPQALACSDPVRASLSGTNGDINEDGSGQQNMGGSQRNLLSPSRREAVSSLGAVAGAQGVAVFRVCKPHAPLMMLNHATANSSYGGGRPVTALGFQPDSTSSFYLAAARGSGVLVWDVSGHSLSPLLGRLAMDVSNNSGGSPSPEFVTTSLSWKLSAERDQPPILTTSAKYSACIWDLRSPVSSSRPSIRFGVLPRKASNSSSPYVQVAWSRSNECALMDAAGTFRIFDIRMNDKTRYSSNHLASITSFVHSGVGISYLPWNGRTAWVTWGLDDPNSDAVVKIWSSASGEADVVGKSDTTQRTAATEDYWYIDGSPDKSTETYLSSYRLLAQCSPPYHLACPRVCPAPVENSIMTIGVRDDIRSKKGGEGWQADLWKIRPPTADEVEANNGTFGMEKVVSFNGGADHDKYIGSVLGRDSDIGQLQAAELAIASYNAYSVPSPKKGENRVHEGISDDDDVGLTLCCLSGRGFVTTHMVPEALPKKFSPHSDGMGHSSPRRGITAANAHTKVYPEDNEGAVADAARIWGTQGERSARDGKDVRSTVEMIKNIHSSPVREKLAIDGIPEQPVLPRASDGGMLFEMDVPAVAYGTVTTGGISGVQVGPIDLASPNAPVASAMAEEADNAAADVRDVAAMAERMDNIETERIPCPRLCGATFGPGIGGLAMFNNGDVRKMWYWYDRAGSTRLSEVPASINAPEQAFSDLGNSVDPAGIGNHGKGLKVNLLRDCPRTMKDLMDMTAAAKEAQWGEVNDADTAADDQDQSSGDNFFEYMSTGSISSDSEEQPAEFVGGIGGKATRLYENYFGSFRRPLAQPHGGGTKKHEDEERQSQTNNAGPAVPPDKMQVVGPSSDTLAPTVHVTHDYDKLALNNQRAHFAKEWELGQWQPEASGIAPVDQHSLFRQRAYFSDPNLNYVSNPFHAPDSPSRDTAGLPSYRGLAPSSQPPSQASRVQSDTMLKMMHSNGAASKKMNQIENEPGVHGGEYPVRPNMQESMVFLRKLFSHQQEGSQFPNLMSPPDSPMLHTKSKSAQNLASMGQKKPDIAGEVNTKHSVSSIDVSYGTSVKARLQPGVYALTSETFGTGVHEDDQKLSQIKKLCQHNANVCARVDDTGKEGVWNLLAQMVDRRLHERPDAFNGWGGRGGGALGVDLVGNIMRYYETLGDVQMLATMVCVLSGGRRRNKEDTRGHLHLLPTGHDQKFDTYIRRYSDLLYGWGLLVKRAELNKHMVQHIQHSEGKILHDATNRGRLPGIALVFTCPRCGDDAEFGTNICRTCQDFAFRCSICENGVRGLFTVCDACGHGGHVGHITSWFAKHTACPAGCGCNCTFTPHPVRGSATETKAPRQDSMGLAGPYILEQA